MQSSLLMHSLQVPRSGFSHSEGCISHCRCIKTYPLPSPNKVQLFILAMSSSEEQFARLISFRLVAGVLHTWHVSLNPSAALTRVAGGGGAGQDQRAWLTRLWTGRKTQSDRIMVHPDINDALIQEAAAATEGFSGRELAKMAASMQVNFQVGSLISGSRGSLVVWLWQRQNMFYGWKDLDVS